MKIYPSGAFFGVFVWNLMQGMENCQGQIIGN